MRAELASLLAGAGIDDVGLSRWDSVIIVRSSGSLIHPTRPVDRNLSDRGFQFLLAGDRGRPRYYCKVRPRMPGAARHRETLVLEAFGADECSRRFVPAVWSSANSRIELQVTQFFQSEPIDVFLRGRGPAEQHRALAEVLDAAAQLSSAALSRPDVFDGIVDQRSLGDLGADIVAVLPDIGVAGDDVDEVRRILDEAGPVRPIPQHGDFWPQNVLRTEAGSWCVVDLDNFGDVMAPLYDVAQMLRTFDDVTARIRSPWIRRLGEPAYAPSRALLRREMERWQLTPAQLGGCLLLYLADIAVRVYRRGAPELFWGRFRDEVPVAVSQIRRCGSVAAFGSTLTSE